MSSRSRGSTSTYYDRDAGPPRRRFRRRAKGFRRRGRGRRRARRAFAGKQYRPEPFTFAATASESTALGLLPCPTEFPTNRIRVSGLEISMPLFILENAMEASLTTYVQRARSLRLGAEPRLRRGTLALHYLRKDADNVTRLYDASGRSVDKIVSLRTARMREGDYIAMALTRDPTDKNNEEIRCVVKGRLRATFSVS